MDKEKFSSRFKELREAKGFTRESLAEVVGVSHIVLGMWEDGDGVPNTDLVIKLCGMLDVCIERLMHSFSWWEKTHGTEYGCSKNCEDCSNALSLMYISEAKEKSLSGRRQAFNKGSAITTLRSIRDSVKNLNFEAGYFVCGWLNLKGEKVSEVGKRAMYGADLDKIIAYLEGLG